MCLPISIAATVYRDIEQLEHADDGERPDRADVMRGAGAIAGFPL